jgi:hypothetical protein
MGQSISKRLDVPRLSNAMKKYEAEVAKEAMDDVAKRQAIARAKGQKYIDPSAQEAGFKRDTWGKNEGLRTEANQRQFLNDNQKNGKDEMPQVSAFSTIALSFVLFWFCMFNTHRPTICF